MTNLEPSSAAGIARFIRQVLGCNCPDEVFHQIEIDHTPGAFPDVPDALLFRIGGRLLVLVMAVAEGAAMAGRLEDVFLRGRALRDAEGYNRFRLVLVSARGGAGQAALVRDLQRQGILDDRLHLHVITPDQAPGYLMGAGTGRPG